MTKVETNLKSVTAEASVAEAPVAKALAINEANLSPLLIYEAQGHIIEGRRTGRYA